MIAALPASDEQAAGRAAGNAGRHGGTRRCLRGAGNRQAAVAAGRDGSSGGRRWRSGADPRQLHADGPDRRQGRDRPEVRRHRQPAAVRRRRGDPEGRRPRPRRQALRRRRAHLCSARQPRLFPGRPRLLVRRRLPRPHDGQRRDFRSTLHRRRAHDHAAAELRARHQRGERPLDHRPSERSRTLPWQPHHRRLGADRRGPGVPPQGNGARSGRLRRPRVARRLRRPHLDGEPAHRRRFPRA